MSFRLAYEAIVAALPQAARLAAISKRLRRERETACCGRIDLAPGKSYDDEAARQALADADGVPRSSALIRPPHQMVRRAVGTDFCALA